MEDQNTERLDLVTDPRSSSRRSVMFDPENSDRRIQVDETVLIELITVR